MALIVKIPKSAANYKRQPVHGTGPLHVYLLLVGEIAQIRTTKVIWTTPTIWAPGDGRKGLTSRGVLIGC